MPAPVAFAAGLAVLLAGLVLRGWSFKTLGQYFTHTVMVSSDQPVITAGATASLTEQAHQTDQPASVTDDASGTLNFTDVDLTDTHTVIVQVDCLAHTASGLRKVPPEGRPSRNTVSRELRDAG